MFILSFTIEFRIYFTHLSWIKIAKFITQFTWFHSSPGVLDALNSILIATNYPLCYLVR